MLSSLELLHLTNAFRAFNTIKTLKLVGQNRGLFNFKNYWICNIRDSINISIRYIILYKYII